MICAKCYQLLKSIKLILGTGATVNVGYSCATGLHLYVTGFFSFFHEGIMGVFTLVYQLMRQPRFPARPGQHLKVLFKLVWCDSSSAPESLIPSRGTQLQWWECQESFQQPRMGVGGWIQHNLQWFSIYTAGSWPGRIVLLLKAFALVTRPETWLPLEGEVFPLF